MTTPKQDAVTGTITELGPRQLDHDRLRALLLSFRPTVTVYLPAKNDRADSDAAHRLELEWSNLRRSLGDRGASELDLDAIDPVTSHADDRGDTIVAIAADGALLAAGFITEPIAAPLGTCAVIPALLPFLGWDQSRIAHVIVVVDRTGADVIAVSPNRDDVGTTITGDDEHIQRSAPGGWSQRRFQQRAENLWENNARDVAAEVDRLVMAYQARAVIVAGDARALGFLRLHLSANTNALVREIDGARADWSIDQIAADTVNHVAGLAVEQLDQEQAAFADALGTGRAVEGCDAVFQALRRARVDTLHVVDDTNEVDNAIGPRPTGCTASDPAHSYPKLDPPDLGSETVFQRAPLHDIALRCAVLTGARIVVIPPGRDAPAEGLGAVLRGIRS